MTDIIVSPDNLAAIGGPAAVNLQVDFGPEGPRGSRIFVGGALPEDFFDEETTKLLNPKIFDLYIDTRIQNGKIYQYQEALEVREWIEISNFVAGPTGPTGAASTVTGPTGPTGPTGATGTALSVIGAVELEENLPESGNTLGDVYFVRDTGNYYVWDGSSWDNLGQIDGPTGPTGPPGDPVLSVQDDFPEDPESGDFWFNSVTGVAAVYYEDEDSAQWVEMGNIGPTGPTGPTGGANSSYTVDEEENWNEVPETIAEALDQLAERIKILEFFLESPYDES
jgi:hypothetical protein